MSVAVDWVVSLFGDEESVTIDAIAENSLLRVLLPFQHLLPGESLFGQGVDLHDVNSQQSTSFCPTRFGDAVTVFTFEDFGHIPRIGAVAKNPAVLLPIDDKIPFPVLEEVGVLQLIDTILLVFRSSHNKAPDVFDDMVKVATFHAI